MRRSEPSGALRRVSFLAPAAAVRAAAI